MTQHIQDKQRSKTSQTYGDSQGKIVGDCLNFCEVAWTIFCGGGVGEWHA